MQAISCSANQWAMRQVQDIVYRCSSNISSGQHWFTEYSGYRSLPQQGSFVDACHQPLVKICSLHTSIEYYARNHAGARVKPTSRFSRRSHSQTNSYLDKSSGSSTSGAQTHFDCCWAHRVRIPVSRCLHSRSGIQRRDGLSWIFLCFHAVCDWTNICEERHAW